MAKSGSGARKAGSDFFHINTNVSALLKQVVELFVHMKHINRQIHKDKHVTATAQQC